MAVTEQQRIEARYRQQLAELQRRLRRVRHRRFRAKHQRSHRMAPNIIADEGHAPAPPQQRDLAGTLAVRQMQHPQIGHDLLAVGYGAVYRERKERRIGLMRHDLRAGALLERHRVPFVVAVGQDDERRAAERVQLRRVTGTHGYRIDKNIAFCAHQEETVEIELLLLVEDRPSIEIVEHNLLHCCRSLLTLRLPKYMVY